MDWRKKETNRTGVCARENVGLVLLVGSGTCHGLVCRQSKRNVLNYDVVTECGRRARGAKQKRTVGRPRSPTRCGQDGITSTRTGGGRPCTAAAAAAVDVRRPTCLLRTKSLCRRRAHVTAAGLPFQETQEHNGSRARIINTSSSRRRPPPLSPAPSAPGIRPSILYYNIFFHYYNIITIIIADHANVRCVRAYFCSRV